MKLQPAQHGPARPALSEVEGVPGGARPVALAPERVSVMPWSAADMREIIPLTFLFPEVYRPGTQGAAPSRRASCTLGGRRSARRLSTPSVCRRHDKLCLTSQRQDYLFMIDRIVVPVIRVHAGSDDNAPRNRHIAS